MPEALTMPCAAAETPATRGVRYAAGALLVLFALAEAAEASLMVTGRRGTPQLLFLFCTLALLVSAVIAVRQRGRAMLAVRFAAIAAAIMLFWSISTGSVPSFTVGGRAYDGEPTFEGMLLAAVLLPALIKQRDSEAACNCR